MRRWMRFIARLYPPGWRARYGDEFDALLEDVRPGCRELLNVLRGALAMQLTAWTFGKTVAAVGLAGAIVAGVISLRMPEQYHSAGVMKIRGRVNAADMAALLRQGFSRHYLNTLINQQGLYKSPRFRKPMEDIIEGMRHDISLAPIKVPTDSDGEAETAIMVRFSYPDAAIAQRTNRELMSRLQEMQGKIYGGVEVLDPASLPERASSPNRAMVTLAGLVAGLLLGAMGVIVRRRPGWTFRVVAVGFVAMLVGTVVSFLIPDKYVSRTVIRVRPIQLPITFLAPNRELLAKIIVKAQLYESVRESKSMDAAVDRMSRDLKVTKVAAAGGHEVDEISFLYLDRYKAQKALREMISLMVVDYADRRGGGVLPPPDSPGYRREFLAWLAMSEDLFEVIDQPSLPEAPVGPNRLVIAMLGLAAGIVAGAVLWRGLGVRRPEACSGWQPAGGP